MRHLSTVRTLLTMETSGCSRAVLSWARTKHGAALVDACVNDLGVVVLYIRQRERRTERFSLLVLAFGNMCLSVS